MKGNISGAVQGGISGGTAGSAFGPWGTAIGSILGATGGFFSGNKDKHKQIKTKTPEQQSLLNNAISMLMGQGAQGGNYAASQDYMRSLLSGDPEAFQRFAAPYQTQFQEQTIPMLAERFAGLGGGLGGGALTSSGFAQALGGAGTQYQSNLSNLYANLQNQAAMSSQNQYGNLLSLLLGTNMFQPAYQPGNPGFGPTSLSGLMQGFGESYGKQLGNKFSDRWGQTQTPNNTNNANIQNTTPPF